MHCSSDDQVQCCPIYWVLGPLHQPSSNFAGKEMLTDIENIYFVENIQSYFELTYAWQSNIWTDS